MEEYEKNIAKAEKEYAMAQDHEMLCDLRVRIARLEEKHIAAADALKLAKDSVSIHLLMSVGTIVLSICAVAVAWIKN